MRLPLLSGLLGFAGIACLVLVRAQANAHAVAATPEQFRLMAAGCWFGVVAGVAGALVAVVARRGAARKEVWTFAVVYGLSVAALSVITRFTALPTFIGTPMRVAPPALAHPEPSPWMAAAARLGGLSIPASELTPTEWQDFTNLFTRKIVPALHKWCSTYGSHSPFKPDEVRPSNLTSRLGIRPKHYSYLFQFRDIRLSAAETEHGSIYVDAVTAPTGKPVAPENPPVAMHDIMKLIKEDSGKEYPTNQVQVVQPPNGDVQVYVGAGVAMAYGPPADFIMVFGPDGKITHYGRGCPDPLEK